VITNTGHFHYLSRWQHRCGRTTCCFPACTFPPALPAVPYTQQFWLLHTAAANCQRPSTGRQVRGGDVYPTPPANGRMVTRTDGTLRWLPGCHTPSTGADWIRAHYHTLHTARSHYTTTHYHTVRTVADLPVTWFTRLYLRLFYHTVTTAPSHHYHPTPAGRFFRFGGTGFRTVRVVDGTTHCTGRRLLF